MDNKDEVREFLTTARSRISPERAGVPVFGGERRVPGLRREEIAQLSGVSTAYYTRMERGSLRGVSESVLNALARGFQLDEAETTHLFDLARAANGPVRARRPRKDCGVSPQIARLIDTMSDVPVVATNRVGDPIASNALGRALFPHLFPTDGPPVNLSVYMFLDKRARGFYPDWETIARGAVSNMRLAAGHDPNDRSLMALVGRLATQSNEFRTWWGGHTVRAHHTGTKDLNHPVIGNVTVNYDVLEVPSAPGVQVTTYLAELGTPSADAIEMLRSWIAEPAVPTEGVITDRPRSY